MLEILLDPTVPFALIGWAFCLVFFFCVVLLLVEIIHFIFFEKKEEK